MSENQTAWNSDNKRIKETVNQTNQTGKAVDRENLQQGSELCRKGWLRWTMRVRLTEQETETQMTVDY